MTLKLKKLKRNKKKGKSKIKFYLLANARITKCNAAFNTKIVSFWIKLSSEKASLNIFIALIKHGVGPQVFPTLVTALPLQCTYKT